MKIHRRSARLGWTICGLKIWTPVSDDLRATYNRNEVTCTQCREKAIEIGGPIQ